MIPDTQIINNNNKLKLIKYNDAFNFLLESRGFEDMHRIQNPIELGNALTFTDSLEEPNVLIMFDIIACDISIYTINIDKLDQVLNEIDFSIGFLTPFKNEINYDEIKFKTLSFDSHFSYSPSLVIRAISLNIEEVVLKHLRKYYKYPKNHFGIFDAFYFPIDNNDEIIKKLKLNIDENVSCLTIDDSEYVNDNWPYKSDISIHFIKWACSQETTGSYRLKNNETGEIELVSWILMYPDGSLGSLYSDPNHRGKGFARKVTSFVLLKKLENTQSKLQKPFLFVKTDNTPSQNLMKSLGFLKSKTQVKWIVCSNE